MRVFADSVCHDNHGEANHFIAEGVAFSVNIGDYVFFIRRIVNVHHGVVELGVKLFAKSGNLFDSEGIKGFLDRITYKVNSLFVLFVRTFVI